MSYMKDKQFLDTNIYAIKISQKYKISYWDSLIVAAAKRAKCISILTEDLNADQKIEAIEIINPF